MEHEQLLTTVHHVVSEFGSAFYLDRSQVAINSATLSTPEVLISVQSDEQATTLAQDLRAKIAEHLEKLNAEGMTRNYDGKTQQLVVVKHAPLFTYRDPMMNEIPNGFLYSVSIGFPLVVAD